MHCCWACCYKNVYIYIYSINYKQHKNKTQTKHTDLSCHTGSCMAHLNCFPPRAAGVNFWFFIAVPFGGGCWYKVKCDMLLRKIDGDMNVQNYGFSAKLRNGDGGDMLHD